MVRPSVFLLFTETAQTVTHCRSRHLDWTGSSLLSRNRFGRFCFFLPTAKKMRMRLMQTFRAFIVSFCNLYDLLPFRSVGYVGSHRKHHRILCETRRTQAPERHPLPRSLDWTGFQASQDDAGLGVSSSTTPLLYAMRWHVHLHLSCFSFRSSP